LQAYRSETLIRGCSLDPKKFDKESEEKGKAGREKALQAEAESERIKKERNAIQK
jgi:hypothetical protein